MKVFMNFRSASTVNPLILFLVIAAFIPYRYLEAQDSSNWKTFTNEKYNYELKHPADFTIRYPEKGNTGLVHFMRGSKSCFSITVNPIPTNAMVVYGGKTRLSSTLSLKEQIVFGLNEICRDKRLADSKVMEMIRWEPIKIGGFYGMQAYASDDECINKVLPVSLLIRNNIRYGFNIKRGSASEYNKILSTFRFIK